ncbi:MAG: hypothetical protein H7066_21270 [Cytophagaceae bacterium]|nr:hypothetical protein [Gemmatimonadaceae bacterium]
MPRRKATPAKQAAAATRGATRGPSVPDESGGPEVFVDFIFDHGLLHVAVVNGTDTAAYDVTVRFDPAFRGLGGEQETSALPLFRGIEFLAPRRRIETFLDRSSDYFQRKEPRRISAAVSWRDARKRRYTRHIVHDLGIYEDVSYLVHRPAPHDTAASTTTSRSTTPRTGRGDHGSPQG